MQNLIHHAGISTLTALTASGLTVAAMINPIGAILFAVGAIWQYGSVKAQSHVN